MPVPRFNEELVRSMFKVADIEVLNVKPLIDGYGYPPTDERYYQTPPRTCWWFVKTLHGWIEIGERKRVVNIDWSDTRARAFVTEEENVTKSLSMVHAWADVDVVIYLKKLREELIKADARHEAMLKYERENGLELKKRT